MQRDNMSDIKKLQREIDSELDLILEDFDGQFDLIGFDKEKFIPIEYELIRNFDFVNPNTNSNNFLRILFEDNNDSNCINMNISKDDFDLKYDELNYCCQSYIEKYEISNSYISLGLIEFNDFLAPAVFIPIFLEKDQNDYKIMRNFNQEIQFNGILKFILNEENVDFPKFDGNINNFIKKLAEVDEIKYYHKAYIGNFDLKFQHLLYDLNVCEWDSIEDKYKLFNENQDILIKLEKEKLNNELQKNADVLGINEDVMHLKSLLSMNNNVLVVTDNNSIREEIINSFKYDDFESLILELSENLSENDFYEEIINNELVIDDNIIVIDNLVKKHDKLSKILDIINANYSNFNISPKEIKMRKDNFTQIIDDLNLDNCLFEIQNIKNFDEEFCIKMVEQIKEIFSFGEDIFNLQNHFSLDYLKSEEFNNLVKISKSIKKHISYFLEFNKKLHNDYQIKIFENLLSVNQLQNIVILDKNPQFIENNDFILLNNYLENFSGVKNEEIDVLQKYFQSDEDVINSIEINIKYTELINNKIILKDSVNSILDDFDEVVKLCKHFINVSRYIIKELYYIIKFYKNFELFEINVNLLKLDNDFENIKKLIHAFNEDIKSLVDFKKDYMSFDILNIDIKNFIKFAYVNKFKEDEIEPVFWFNIYNSLLSIFLNEYTYIDENRIIEKYESEFVEIDAKLIYNPEQLLIQHIYSKSLAILNSEKTINQKVNMIKNHDERNIESIKVMLSKYKEFITANKRIFLINMGLISQLLDKSYENHFDCVIITQDFKYKLDRLSLLLRSKNKIFKV